MNDLLDWLDAGKLGIAATATVALCGYRYQGRQAEKQRVHEKQLDDQRRRRDRGDFERRLYADFLGVVYRLVGAWFQLADAPPKTKEEHDLEFERREPLHASENALLAEIRIVAPVEVVDAAESLHAVQWLAAQTGRRIVDGGHHIALEWPPVDVAMKAARQQFVDTVRVSLAKSSE